MTAPPHLPTSPLGKEHLHPPRTSGAVKDLPLMKPARHSLPEFDAVWRDAEARPVLRAHDRLSLVLPLVLLHARLEIRAAIERPTLGRRPGADLAAARSRREVGVG